MIENNANKFKKAALFVTEKCNLRCDYCYQKRNPEDIKPDKAQEAIDFLFENSQNLFTLTFFGGEPLIDMPLLMYLMDYSSKKFFTSGKKINFSINTNGTLLSENALRLLSKFRVNLILSIDGMPELHDLHRKTAAGRGSFELIKENLPHIIKYPALQARITVSPHMVCKLVENVNYVFKLGFNTMGLALTRDCEGWDSEIFQELKKQYNELAEWYIDKLKSDKDVRFTDIDVFIAKGDRSLKEGRPPCSAGDTSISIGTDGLLYPCHRFVGIEKASIGDIKNGINKNKIEKFKNFDPYKVKGCEKCPHLEVCYKCMWLSYVKTGELNSRIKVACAESKAFINAAETVRKTLEKENIPHYMERISLMEKLIKSNKSRKRNFL